MLQVRGGEKDCEGRSSTREAVGAALVSACFILGSCDNTHQPGAVSGGNSSWASDVGKGVSRADEFLSAHPQFSHEIAKESLELNFIFAETLPRESFIPLLIQGRFLSYSPELRRALLDSFNLPQDSFLRSLTSAESFLSRPEIENLALTEDQMNGARELYILANLLDFESLQKIFATDYALSKRLPLELLTPLVRSLEAFIEEEKQLQENTPDGVEEPL